MIATTDSDVDSGLSTGVRTRIGVGIDATVVSIELLTVILLIQK